MNDRNEFFNTLVHLKMPDKHRDDNLYLRQCLVNYNISKSQMFQDVFVMHALGWKKGGFFVEIGAADGITLSNTYMLENLFGWNGILSEPSPVWKQALQQNRNCALDYRAVHSISHARLEFSTSPKNAEFSSFKHLKHGDNHAAIRADFDDVIVETVSLVDLLDTWNAPKNIDYISIDTEGAELDIISSFDFTKYNFRVLTVEHNYGNNRPKIKEILLRNGYEHVFEEYSLWDDWYVLNEAKFSPPS